ncbi:glyoxalase [Pseudonocardia sp. DSM 110487]|jgi:predicted enzyme related to lactoylglutathione lyase|nr:glyoxalase [Pseudonocardia sp. DSM 110487]
MCVSARPRRHAVEGVEHVVDGIETVVHPVKDLEQAKILYRALTGVAPVKDEPYYVGFDVDGRRIGLDPNGHRKGMTGPIVYWRVTDITRSVQELVDAGAEVQQDVKDVGGGAQTALIRDADGNVIGLLARP